MTTYHVELTGHCDVIVEANSEQEAFDRAVARIPASSLSIETAEVKGVLEGEALKQAYRYFPEHLAMVDTSVFESEEPVLISDKFVTDNLDNVYYARKRMEKADGITELEIQFLLEDAMYLIQDLCQRKATLEKEAGVVGPEVTIPKYQLLEEAYSLYKQAIGRENYTMDRGNGWVDSSGIPKLGTYDSTQEEVIVSNMFNALINSASKEGV